MTDAIYTGGQDVYTYQPIRRARFNFSVRAANDAHLALLSSASESEPIVEIFIGGWQNSKSAIRFNKQQPNVIERETPDILSAGDFRDFWISWDELGTASLGNAGSHSPFLSWTNPEPFHVTHVGFRTSWGSEGTWKFEGGNEEHTEDKLEYTIRPVPAGEIHFRVRAKNDAHVALTSAAEDTSPMVEVFIGGWGNTKSAIRYNREKPDKAEVETPDILHESDFRTFWLKWRNGVVEIGRAGEQAPFMSWNNPEPSAISHVGVRTTMEADGHWFLTQGQGTLPPASSDGASGWVDAAGGDIPPNAFEGGQDQNGEVMYVGRAAHEGDLIPGKIVPSHGACYVPWGGAEHPKSEYQVLTNTGAYEWVPVSGQAVPGNALHGGSTSDGEVLFVGRAAHEDSLTVGKVHRSHGTCYIPFGGAEHGYADYEVLVSK